MIRILMIFCWLGSRAFAFQSGGTEEARVSIVPRQAEAAPRGLPQNVLRIDSSLVLVPARVTNAAGASLGNLQVEDFQLLEDGVEQEISYFSTEDAPVSVGLVLDTSASMKNKMDRALESAKTFFQLANPEDEFCLVEFNRRPTLAIPFTPDAGELSSYISRSKASGQTSLFDAILVALKEMKNARNPRKALVIVSDGGDNWSRHNLREMRHVLLESAAQVYAMGVFDPDYMQRHPAEERRGPMVLDELAHETGGRSYPVSRVEDLPEIGARISRDLRQQYLLAYYPTNTRDDGKYRSVTLRLITSDQQGLRLEYRHGYYSQTH